MTQTNDISLIGTYNIGVWVYWVNYPYDAYGASAESFSITITEVNCDVAQISASVTNL